MADTYLPLLKGILAALKADSTISATVAARVYTEVPQNPTFPYLQVRLQSDPFDTKTELGMEHIIDISAYSRADTPFEAGTLRAAVYDILNRGESNLTLDSGTLSRMIYSGIGDVVKEPDGITWKGFARFNAIVD